MRKTSTIIMCALVCALYSCSPVVTSNITHHYSPLKTVNDVVVLNEKDPVPGDATWMGSVEVKGSGSRNLMMDLTRREAWENGARYVKVKDYTSSLTRSDIHAMNSDLYWYDFFDDPGDGDVNSVIDQKSDPDIIIADNTDSPLYLIADGQAEYSRVNKIGNGSFTFALGAGYSISPKFSLELGAEFSNMSMQTDEESHYSSMGLAASLVYHHRMKGNLYYVPQVEFDYLDFQIEDNRIGFVALGISLLALEYRGKDSMWGIRGSLGELGIAFPTGDKADLGAFQMEFGPIYVISLNRVSLGIVRYF